MDLSLFSHSLQKKKRSWQFILGIGTQESRILERTVWPEFISYALEQITYLNQGVLLIYCVLISCGDLKQTISQILPSISINLFFFFLNTAKAVS